MKLSPRFTDSEFWALSLLAIFCVVFPTLSSSAAERFQLKTETYQTQEDGQITHYLLFTETNKFSFMPPRVDWTVETSASDKTVNFISPERSVTIAMQIAETNSTLPSESQMEWLRHQALARFPTAHIVKEFTS